MSAPDTDLLFSRARAAAGPADADRDRVRARLSQTLAAGAGVAIASGLAAKGGAVATGTGATASKLGALAGATWLTKATVGAIVVVALGAAALTSKPRAKSASDAPHEGPARTQQAPRARSSVVTRPRAEAVASAGAAEVSPPAAKAPSTPPLAKGTDAPAVSRALPMPPVHRSDLHAPGWLAAPAAAAPAAEAIPTPSAAVAAPDDGALQELGLVARMQAALRVHDARATLALVAEHEARFAHGALVPEREGARAIARCEGATPGDARAIGRAFLAAYPSSPLAPRVRGACGGGDGR
jgi:hypothetical protein